MRTAVSACAAWAVVVLVAARPALAQKAEYKGFAQCVDCHDHDDQKLWAQKKDGPPPNNHLNSLAQMENPKSADFAKAVGLDPNDIYNPAKSSCVPCHATIVKAPRTLKGVYCETCHGAGSLYFEPHKTKGAYAQAITLGMADVVKKPEAWGPFCMKCHVMDDPRLIAAKHPSGDDFDLGAKFTIVATGHWKSTYDRAQISAIGKREAAKLIAARRSKGGAVATPTAPAPAPALQAAAPAPTPVPTPAAPAPKAAPPQRGGPAPAVAPSPKAPAASRSAEPRPAPAPAPPPQIARGPDATMPGLPAGVGAAANAPAAVPDAAASVSAMSSLVAILPESPAAAVAALQGRAIAMLDSLLRRGASAPVRVTPPDTKTEYRGPDADLLRLQQEVLSLAIEALRTRPQAAPPAK